MGSGRSCSPAIPRSRKGRAPAPHGGGQEAGEAVEGAALGEPGEGKRTPLLRSPFNEYDLRFSPDGRAVAFDSDVSGQPEVYVALFPEVAPHTRVSQGGGTTPRWSRSGRELFYLSGDGHLVAVPVRTVPGPDIGRPVRLFAAGGSAGWSEFEVSSDGRFLAVVPVVVADEQPLTVLVNWPAEFGR